MLGAAFGFGVLAPAAMGFTTRSLEEGFGPDGSATSEFSAPWSIAIDHATGDTYVADLGTGTIEKFNAAHQPEAFTGASPQIVGGKLTGFGTASASEIAVGATSDDLYVAGGGAGVDAYQSDGEPADFTAGPAVGTNELAGTDVCGVAIDMHGEIYESEFSSGIRIFEPNGEPVATIPVTGACDLAVDSDGDVYYSEPGGPARKLTPSEFPVTPFTAYSAPVEVDANPTSAVAVETSDNNVLVDEGNQVAEYDPAGDRLGAFGSGGSQPLAGSTGLAVSASQHVYVTNDGGTPHQVDIFGAPNPLPPSIDAASATNLAANSADLTGKINPGGLSTSYRFEYGTGVNYGTRVPVPDAQVGEGFGDVAVEQHIQGLSLGETYHWRIVASGPGGTSTGVDHTFVYDKAGEDVPYGRTYEMITPPQKNAALIGMVFKGLKPIVADDGSHVIMTSIQCFADAESCTGSRQTVGEQFLFSRTSSGWVTTALAPPATQYAANSTWLANAETGMELFSMPTPPALEDDFYVRTPAGEFDDLGPTTPPSLGPIGLGPFDSGAMAATSDFSHVIYQAHTPWVSEAAGEQYQLYEFEHAGMPKAPLPVGVSGGAGSKSLISLCGTSFNGSPSSNLPGTVSADGDVIYFTAEACPAGNNNGVEIPASAVYARIDQARTVKISERSPTECKTIACQNSTAQTALFVGASDDGSRAFFLSNQRLTDEASEEGNLYEYEFRNFEEEGSLIDASAGASGGEAPSVQGVVALSSDGSHVYFVAKGKLSAAPNGRGETASSGAENLYVFSHESGQATGRIAFITQLSEADSELWETNEDQGTANVTSDGRYLVFESRRNLTADDTRTDGAVQVFRYDAATGELARISIGQRGFNNNGNDGTGNAHIVPAFEDGPHDHAGPARSDPTMSDDGKFVFFESPIALTPRAVDDIQIGVHRGRPVYAENVYEWHEGEVHLISDGKDIASLAVESVVKLIGSDTSGRNVFFRTADALVPQDTDTQIDYYDARICTSEEPCISTPASPPSPCQGEGCHGVPSAPSGVPSGGSSTLNGEITLSAARGKSSKHRHKKARRINKKRKCVVVKRRMHHGCTTRRAKRGKAGVR